MTTKLQRLQDMPIHGNAHDDQDRLTLAHEIITDPNSNYDDQIAALSEIDRTMGVEYDLNQQAIDDYLADVRGLRATPPDPTQTS